MMVNLMMVIVFDTKGHPLLRQLLTVRMTVNSMSHLQVLVLQVLDQVITALTDHATASHSITAKALSAGECRK